MINKRDQKSAVSKKCAKKYKRLKKELKGKIWRAKNKVWKEFKDLERDDWDLAYNIVCNNHKKLAPTTTEEKMKITLELFPQVLQIRSKFPVGSKE